jgi:hypothetical protein
VSILNHRIVCCVQFLSQGLTYPYNTVVRCFSNVWSLSSLTMYLVYVVSIATTTITCLSTSTTTQLWPQLQHQIRHKQRWWLKMRNSVGQRCLHWETNPSEQRDMGTEWWCNKESWVLSDDATTRHGYWVMMQQRDMGTEWWCNKESWVLSDDATKRHGYW